MPEYEFVAKEITDNAVDVYAVTGFLWQDEGSILLNVVVVEDKPPDVDDAETDTLYLVVATNESV